VGIRAAELERVFEPFFSTRRKGTGTGLGLSIVKNIVEQHRGTIEIQSEVGTGTTVSVTLPCSDP
jgi:signal transduction histidine kinase